MSTVFKYVGVAGISRILDAQEIAFTSVRYLNDVDEGTLDIFDQTIEQERRSHDFITEWEANRRGCTTQEAREFLVAEGLDREIGLTVANRYLATAFADNLRNVGVFCASREIGNLLLWAHYCEGGQGIAIGFRQDANIFSESRVEGLQGWQDVTYQDERASGSGISLTERLRSGLCTKGSDWSYEKEIRCFRVFNGREKSENRIVVSFDSSDLVEIIVGARASMDTIKRCFDLVEDRYTSARVRFAVPSGRRYEVEVADIRSRKIAEVALRPEPVRRQPYQLDGSQGQ